MTTTPFSDEYFESQAISLAAEQAETFNTMCKQVLAYRAAVDSAKNKGHSDAISQYKMYLYTYEPSLSRATALMCFTQDLFLHHRQDMREMKMRIRFNPRSLGTNFLVVFEVEVTGSDKEERTEKVEVSFAIDPFSYWGVMEYMVRSSNVPDDVQKQMKKGKMRQLTEDVVRFDRDTKSFVKECRDLWNIFHGRDVEEEKGRVCRDGENDNDAKGDADTASQHSHDPDPPEAAAKPELPQPDAETEVPTKPPSGRKSRHRKPKTARSARSAPPAPRASAGKK